LRVLGKGLAGEIGSAAAIEVAGKPYVPIHDSSGNLVLLLDNQGQLIEKHSYSAFGEEESTLSISPWKYSNKSILRLAFITLIESTMLLRLFAGLILILQALSMALISMPMFTITL
jgi:hypothetical protein